ncbi:MAG: dihydroorotase [Deltaproteobacteria bacterium]|nr:MAG: dihydroorotase [Deltaproteobacteria bacterium]
MSLTLTSPLDMHLHLREGEMLKLVAPFSAAHFSAGVIMPNLVDPVTNRDRLTTYRHQIESACARYHFTPLMTLFFQEYSRETLTACREQIIGVKLYPAGITTQSDSGVRDLETAFGTIALLEELGIPLLVHGESSGFVLEREREFLTIYEELATTFPNLHLVMEHITTADALDTLNRFDNISATVTLHHLLITLDDVVGGLMRPELFCKPIAKTPQDRAALRDAVLGGHPRLMFGSDSAPHPRHAKECCGCAAGVFTAPVALAALAEIFVEAGHPQRLQGFVSDIACKRYQLLPETKYVRLEERPWQVPQCYGEIRPFLAGETLRWQVTAVREEMQKSL